MLSYDSYGAHGYVLQCACVVGKRDRPRHLFASVGFASPPALSIFGRRYPRPGGRRRDLFVILCFHCRFSSIAFGTWKRENERISVVRTRCTFHRCRSCRGVTSVITPPPPSPRRVAVAVTDVFVYVSADHR